MNAFVMIAADDALRLANERMQELHREQAVEQMRHSNRRPGAFRRIVAAVSSIPAAMRTVEPDFGTLPALTDYPNRS